MTGFTDEDRWTLLRQILSSAVFTSDRQRIGAIQVVLASREPFVIPKRDRRDFSRRMEAEVDSRNRLLRKLRVERERRERVQAKLLMATATLRYTNE